MNCRLIIISLFLPLLLSCGNQPLISSGETNEETQSAEDNDALNSDVAIEETADKPIMVTGAFLACISQSNQVLECQGQIQNLTLSDRSGEITFTYSMNEDGSFIVTLDREAHLESLTISSDDDSANAEAEAEAEVARAAQAGAQAETEAAKAAQAEEEAEAEAARAAQAEAEAQAEAARAAQAEAEAEAASAAQTQLDLEAAIADPTKYVFEGQIYARRTLDDSSDCDSSLECSNDEICLNDSGEEENQASNDDLFPHTGDPTRPFSDIPGNEECR